MSLPYPASGCFLLPLLALGGFLAGAVTLNQSPLNPSLSGQSDDWTNYTTSNIDLGNETADSSSLNERFEFNRSSSVDSIPQESDIETDTFIITTPIDSSITSEADSLTARSSKYNSALRKGMVDSSMTFRVDETVDQAGSEDFRHNLSVGLDVESKVDNDGEVDATDDPTTIERTTPKETTSSDSKTITEDNSTVPTASTTTSTIYEKESARESLKHVSSQPEVNLTPTHETYVASLYDIETHETLAHLPNEESPTVAVGEHTRFAVVTQNNTPIEEESSSWVERQDRNRSSSGTDSTRTRNSIWPNDQRTTVDAEVDEKFEKSNGKWKKTWTSYAEPPKGDLKETANRVKVIESRLTEKMRIRESAKNDDENAEEPRIAIEPSMRIIGVTKFDGNSSSSEVVGEEKRTGVRLLQILNDTIAIEGERLKVNEKLLRAINETVGRANIAHDGSLSESCRMNTDGQTSNRHARPPWNSPSYRETPLRAAPIPQVPQQMPAAPVPSFAKLLMRSVPENTAAYSNDQITSNIGLVTVGELSGLKPILSLPLVPNDRIYEDSDFLPSDILHDDYPSEIDKAILLEVKCTRVCRTVEITPRLICRRTKTLCVQDYYGYGRNCRPGRIVCDRKHLDSRPGRTKLICENLPIPVDNSKVDYIVQGSLPFGRRCSVDDENIRRWYPLKVAAIERDGEHNALQDRNPPGLEEVEQVYGGKTAAEWGVGVVEAKSRPPGAMRNHIVYEVPDLVESSYTKGVPTARSLEGPASSASSEVAKEIILEAIHRVMRDEVNGTSKGPVSWSHTKMRRMPMASTRSNVVDQKRSMDVSTSSSLMSNQSIVSIDRDGVNNTENVQNTENIETKKDFVDANKNLDNRTSASMDSLSSIVEENSNQLHILLKRLSEINTNVSCQVQANPSVMDTKPNSSVKFGRNPVATTAIEASVKDEKSTPAPASPIVPAVATRVVPVEPQPVAVTNDKRQSSQTTTARHIIETPLKLTNVNARRSSASTATVDSPSRFDQWTIPNGMSDSSSDHVKGIMQRVSDSLFDSRPATISVKNGGSVNDVTNDDKTESNGMSTQASYSSESTKVNFRSDVTGQRDNLPGDHGALRPVPTIQRPPASTANNIVVNEEKHINTETNRNVSMNHNANFNQSTADAQVTRGEPIKIASHPVLEMQRTDRSVPSPDGLASDPNFPANSSIVAHNSNDEMHIINSITNGSVTRQIFENPKTGAVAPTMNPRIASNDERVNLAANGKLDQTAEYAMNQSSNVNWAANLQQNRIDGGVIRSAKQNLKHIDSSNEDGNYTSADAKMNDHAISNWGSSPTVDSNEIVNPLANYDRSSNVTRNDVVGSDAQEFLVENVTAKDKLRKTGTHSWDGNYNTSEKAKVNRIVNLKIDLNTAIGAGVNALRTVAGRTVDAIIGQSPLNPANSIRATEAPRPIMGALNSIAAIAAKELDGVVNRMQQPAQASNSESNQPLRDSGATLAVARTSFESTESPNGRQHNRPIIDTKSNLDRYSTSNYNASSSDNGKVAAAFPSQTAPSGFGESSSSDNAKHEKGWYELWYNSGERGKDDWTEIWNNKRFKRFLVQQLQEMRNDEIGHQTTKAFTPNGVAVQSAKSRSGLNGL